jgi:hypothetical protein
MKPFVPSSRWRNDRSADETLRDLKTHGEVWEDLYKMVHAEWVVEWYLEVTME